MASILVNATHGKEDAERATLPFIVGNVAASADQETVVLLTVEGVLAGEEGLRRRDPQARLPATQGDHRLVPGQRRPDLGLRCLHQAAWHQ
jgi:hypothetical protein